MTALLEATGLHVRFGAVEALSGVSFDLAAGKVTGLIGPNGAGKTTLIDALMGFVPLAAGEVRLDGQPLAGTLPHQRASLGIARTFQSLELFDDLTVTENLVVAAENAGHGLLGANETLERIGLSESRDRLAVDLSPSDRKALALGRSLVARPRLLMVDEPAAGLDRTERARLVELLRECAAAGIGVLLVDHDLGVVLDACDRVLVLDAGQLIADGSPDEVRNDPKVTATYLGTNGAVQQTAVAPTRPSGQTVVAATGLCAGYGGGPVIRDVDLHVAAGEIVALLGPNGAGKTTTLLALSGALPNIQGDVQILGAPIDGRPHRLARRGVAHVLQRHKVFTGLTVADNLRLADHSGDGARSALTLFPALGPLLDKPGAALSGGEQQLLAVARAIASRPRLLILDEPSLGLAPGAVRDLLDALARLCDQSGTAVLIAEQHAHLALNAARRVYVLVAGRVVLQGPAAEIAAHPERLTTAYLGGTAEPA